jgi:aldehyde:ferredoxin oxidoreductase
MALPGTTGKVLFANLSTAELTIETPPEEVYLDYLGGYGMGAYYLYQRQKPGVDALGPDNTLGFLPGVLTGAPGGINCNRFTVVGKSPKTGGWGDANCGGKFGPAMKQAGFDAVFVTGSSDRPVSLVLQNGEAKLAPADDWWGLDTNDTEAKAKEAYGAKTEVASIGPTGEQLRLLACIITDLGRAAGRSGLGAVMGAKKLKAVVAVAEGKVDVADADGLKAKAKECRTTMKAQPFYDGLKAYGTGGGTGACVEAGDAGIKNWAGIPSDFPTADNIGGESLKAMEKKKYGCWRCAIICGGKTETPEPFKADHHKPEYETLGSFGSMCLNDSIASINVCNEICNRYGMDTIATGCTVAFAMECFDKGILTTEDTGGLDLSWGNAQSVVKLTRMMAEAEGLGDILADGACKAAERIGKGAEACAMHVGGEEVLMHDPRLNPSLGVSYKMDATPGRHTQLNGWAAEQGFTPVDMEFPPIERYKYAGKGETNRIVSNFFHSVNSAGMCMFSACNMTPQQFVDHLTLVTGKEFTLDRVLEAGHRSATLRILFNLREGVKNVDIEIPGRLLGNPPLEGGPLDGVTLDNDVQVRDYLEAMGWDPATGVPTQETVARLGLDFATG